MDIDNLLAGLSDEEDESLTARGNDLVDKPLDSEPFKNFPLCVSIDNCIAALYEKISKCYAQAAPELASLVSDKVLFCKVIILLGVDPAGANLDQMHSQLTELVGKQTFMSLRLSPFKVPDTFVDLDDCKLVERLATKKQSIFDAAVPRMPSLAPNLLCIISPLTCAHILAYTGSLESLAATPSANIPSLGASTLGPVEKGRPRQGILWRDPIFQGVNSSQMRSATRIVAGKIVLSARVDLTATDGKPTIGVTWGKYVRERLDKLGAPPPNKVTKALPVPQEIKSKSRGGKRVRKFKEKYALSDFHKQRNKLSFGLPGEKPATTSRISAAPSQLELSKKMRERLQNMK